MDQVGRTRLAKFCESRDDSLSWYLSRVQQGGAIRANDMDTSSDAVVQRRKATHGSPWERQMGP